MALNDVHETFLGLSCRVCMYVCMSQALGFGFWVLNCEMRIERAGFGENKKGKNKNPNIVNM